MGRTKKYLALMAVLVLSLLIQPAAYVQKADAAAKTAVKNMKLRVDSQNVTKRTYTMKAGETAKLTVTASPKAAVKAGVSYESSDKSVASVNKNGRISAKKAGAANITVTISSTKYKTTSTWVTVYVEAASSSRVTMPSVVALDKGSVMGYSEVWRRSEKCNDYGTIRRRYKGHCTGFGSGSERAV